MSQRFKQPPYCSDAAGFKPWLGRSSCPRPTFCDKSTHFTMSSATVLVLALSNHRHNLKSFIQSYPQQLIFIHFPSPFRLQASRPRAVYASTSSSTAFQPGARQQPPTPPPLPPKPDEGGTTGDSNTNCAAGEAEVSAAAPRPGPSWLQLHHEHQLLRAALAARKNRRTMRQPLLARHHRLPRVPPDLNALDHGCVARSTDSSSEHTSTRMSLTLVYLSGLFLTDSQ